MMTKVVCLKMKEAGYTFFLKVKSMSFSRILFDENNGLL